MKRRGFLASLVGFAVAPSLARRSVAPVPIVPVGGSVVLCSTPGLVPSSTWWESSNFSGGGDFIVPTGSFGQRMRGIDEWLPR